MGFRQASYRAPVYTIYIYTYMYIYRYHIYVYIYVHIDIHMRGFIVHVVCIWVHRFCISVYVGFLDVRGVVECVCVCVLDCDVAPS